MRLSALPERLVILGGGFIGAEFAHVFSALGSAVSRITHGPLLLRQQDESVAAAFTAPAHQRWDVHLSQEVLAVRGDADEIRLQLTDGTIVSGDELDLDRAGIRVHADGRVAVDGQQRGPGPRLPDGRARGSTSGDHLSGALDDPPVLLHRRGPSAEQIGRTAQPLEAQRAATSPPTIRPG